MTRAEFQIRSSGGVEWIESRSLTRFPWLLHAFSTRRRGAGTKRELDFGRFESSRSAASQESRRRFLAAIGAEEFTVAAARQIHSAVILRAEPGARGRLRYFPPGHDGGASAGFAAPCGDALITRSPGILISVRTADCLPVLIADPRTRAVAAVHAGWRGALARIVEKTAGEMRRVFGSKPEDLVAALGPSIRPCCYEVGDDVVEAFQSQFTAAESFFRRIPATTAPPPPVPAFLDRNPPGHAPPRRSARALDLIAVALAQLKAAGVRRRHVAVANFCTSCRNDLFFSARREGQQTGRMIAVIGVNLP